MTASDASKKLDFNGESVVRSDIARCKGMLHSPQIPPKARSPAMTLTPQIIKQVVAGHDDFGHEMRVREVIRSIRDAESMHGGTYLDSITGKPRQFDFRCSLRREECSFQFAVECKNLSVNAPAVICGINRSAEEAFHEIIEARCGFFTEPGVVMDGDYSLTRRIEDSSAYCQGSFTGKSIVRVKPLKDNKGYTIAPDSDVYDAWSQALSSAYDLCKSASGYARKVARRHFFNAVIPVVVVSDDSLWALKYDDDGVARSEPSKTEHCSFFVDRGLAMTGWDADQKFALSHIHFCTLSGFKSWMASVQDDENVWSQWFPPAALAKWKA